MSSFKIAHEVQVRLETPDPLAEIRKDYVGGRFDLSALESNGLTSVDPSNPGWPYTETIRRRNDEWQIEYWFDEEGELWDVMASGVKRKKKSVFLKPSLFPFEQRIRKKLESELVAPVEEFERQGIVFLMHGLELFSPGDIYPQIMQLINDCFKANVLMARRCLVEVARSPELLPQKDMLIPAAFLAHEFLLQQEACILAEKAIAVVRDDLVYLRNLTFVLLSLGFYESGMMSLLCAARFPITPQWGKISQMLMRWVSR